jgi:hypothetical protein
MEIKNAPVQLQVEEMDKVSDVSRRRFFQLAGGIAGAGLVLSACRRTPSSDVYVGAGDIGLLNYLYVIKQVTAAFWAQAVVTPYYGITKSESDLQPDLRDQEVAHREFLKTMLGKQNLGTVVPIMSAVIFADKTSFLNNAIILEDLNTAAYNGAVGLFTDTSYVSVIAKMASVDARHAAYVRNILTANALGDGAAVGTNGLNQTITPQAGMTAIGTYLQTKFDTSKLPS